MRIGEVEFDVTEPKTRCLATHANPETGERDVPLVQVDKTTWEAATDARTPMVVTYLVYAYDASVRTGYAYRDGRFRCGQVNVLVALTDIGPGDGATMVVPATPSAAASGPAPTIGPKPGMASAPTPISQPAAPPRQANPATSSAKPTKSSPKPSRFAAGKLKR